MPYQVAAKQNIQPTTGSEQRTHIDNIPKIIIHIRESFFFGKNLLIIFSPIIIPVNILAKYITIIHKIKEISAAEMPIPTSFHQAVLLFFVSFLISFLTKLIIIKPIIIQAKRETILPKLKTSFLFLL